MTRQCHVKILLKINMIFLDLPSLNGILSVLLRLCNISVVKFQCPTFTFYSDFLKMFTSVGHLGHSPFKYIIIVESF